MAEAVGLLNSDARARVPSLPAQALQELADALGRGEPAPLTQEAFARAWDACDVPGPLLDVLLRHRGLCVKALALRLVLPDDAPVRLAQLVRDLVLRFVDGVLLEDLEPRRAV